MVIPRDKKDEAAPPKSQPKKEETQPSEEWGERADHSRAIARGGKTHGKVPGSSTEAEA